MDNVAQILVNDFELGNSFGMVASAFEEYKYKDFDNYLKSQNTVSLNSLSHSQMYADKNWDAAGDIRLKPFLEHILDFQAKYRGCLSLTS